MYVFEIANRRVYELCKSEDVGYLRRHKNHKCSVTFEVAIWSVLRLPWTSKVKNDDDDDDDDNNNENFIKTSQ